LGPKWKHPGGKDPSGALLRGEAVRSFFQNGPIKKGKDKKVSI